MTDIKQLNKDRLARLKADGISHGLRVLIYEIQQAQQFNAEQPQTRRNGEEYRRKMVTVYFSWVTDNRLMAHIITNNGDNSTLERLVIPEAGHRLYAHYKDGYQANGGGYSKPLHILDAMVWQARKHTTTNNWQDFIRAEVIA
jgi:hypothetical protein